jgi:hypothetical protein
MDNEDFEKVKNLSTKVNAILQGEDTHTILDSLCNQLARVMAYSIKPSTDLDEVTDLMMQGIKKRVRKIQELDYVMEKVSDIFKETIEELEAAQATKH